MSVPRTLSSAARTFIRAAAAGASRLRAGALCRRPIVRKMSSERQMDHLEKTARDYRQNTAHPAQVCGITNESDTVKRLRLAVHPDFNFKAGQWVDFFIPGLEKVGGFSLCSSPGMLQREGVVELAVKYTTHLPAHWIHTTCTVGSPVAMRVGGNFFFDPLPSDPPVDLLLVAGGVGINPLYSILLHVADLLHSHRGEQCVGCAHLCYSAKSPQELLFKNTIVEMCRKFPDNLSCDLHVTDESIGVDQHILPFVRRGRITENQLKAHVDPGRTLCYLCGPPPMIEATSQTLADLGLPKDRIVFEKWW